MHRKFTVLSLTFSPCPIQKWSPPRELTQRTSSRVQDPRLWVFCKAVYIGPLIATCSHLRYQLSLQAAPQFLYFQSMSCWFLPFWDVGVYLEIPISSPVYIYVYISFSRTCYFKILFNLEAELKNMPLILLLPSLNTSRLPEAKPLAESKGRRIYQRVRNWPEAWLAH